MTIQSSDEKVLTGRKVFLMFAAGFGLIIAVNFWMAYNAVKTFPGLEVKNSYIASQSFDAERNAQSALGWRVETAYVDGVVTVSLLDAVGLAPQVASFEAKIGRTTHQREDIVLEMTRAATVYSAPVTLAPGRWYLRLNVVAADGTEFQQRHSIYVRP